MLSLADERSQRGYPRIIGPAWRRDRKIARERIPVGREPQQLRQEQEIGTRDRSIQGLKRQDVRACVQEAHRVGQVELNPIGGRGIGPGRGGRRVEERQGGRVAAGDFSAIQRRDKAILESHSEGEADEIGGIGDLKGHAGVETAALGKEHRLDIQSDERKEIDPCGLAIIANSSATQCPIRIVEIHLGPVQCKSIVGRHQRTHGCARADQSHGRRISHPPVGNIGHLGRKGGRKLGNNAAAIRRHEGEILPASAEFEIRVERSPRSASIFLRSEHDQVTERWQVGRWELPLHQVVGGVREKPAAQTRADASFVVNFDPIRVLAILIVQDRDVGGHEFSERELSQTWPCRTEHTSQQESAQHAMSSTTHRLPNLRPIGSSMP